MVAWLCVCCAGGAIGKDSIDCEALRAVLKQRKEKLTEYIEALKMSQEHGDMRLIQAFCNKIDRLADEIREAEETHNCPEELPSQNSPGLSPIKTDAAAFVTQSCGELRRMQVMLLIKINALRRRDQSVFSQLNTKERDSLENASETLTNVRNALKARCPEEPPNKKRGRRSGAGSGHSPARREVR
jgi:hypothetical protein